MKKKLIIFGIKILITISIMVILLKTVNFREIAFALKEPENPFFIYLAVFLLLPNLLFQWYRWNYLLRMMTDQVYFLESMGSLLGGMVVGFITPGRIGELGRSFFIHHIDRLQAVGLVFIDKLYSFIVILIGGVWGIVLFISYLFKYELYLLLPLCTIALLISIISFRVMIHPQWIRSIFYGVSILFPTREKLKTLIHCIDHFGNRQAQFFTVLTFCFYIIYIFQFCLLGFAFQPISLTTALTATTSTILAKTVLPISFGDLGIREGAAMFFYLKFNVEKVTAFNSSLLLFVINILIPTFIGMFFFFRLNWNTKERKTSKKSMI